MILLPEVVLYDCLRVSYNGTASKRMESIDGERYFKEAF
jgi:hypothetical protein